MKKKKFLRAAAVVCLAVVVVAGLYFIASVAGAFFTQDNHFKGFFGERTYRSFSKTIYRERISPVSSGIVKKFIVFKDGTVLDEFVLHPNTSETKNGESLILKNKLMVAEKGDTVCYRKWSDGKTEITDVRFADK